MQNRKRRKIVIGNWKMNPESAKLAEKLYRGLVASSGSKGGAELVVCPPFVYLPLLRKISRKISLGAQNIATEIAGAHTGEVAGSMVYDAGARYVILGHSERRAVGETDDAINRKVKIAVKEGLVPILCVGERERDAAHEYFETIRSQLELSLDGVSKSAAEKMVIAYEPVWAIGKDAVREATPEEFREVAIFAKKVLSDKFGGGIARDIRIIYGGSVNPKNARDFVVEGGADGFLVGRDSLDAKKFLQIIQITRDAER